MRVAFETVSYPSYCFYDTYCFSPVHKVCFISHKNMTVLTWNFIDKDMLANSHLFEHLFIHLWYLAFFYLFQGFSACLTIYEILSPRNEVRLIGSLLLFLFVFKFHFKKVDAFSQPSGSSPSYHKFLKVTNNGAETASDYFLVYCVTRAKFSLEACAKADRHSTCSLQN